jgi:hypothetical protein
MPNDQRSVERGRKEVLALGALTSAAVAILAIQAWLTTGHFPGWLWPGCLLLVGALSAVASRRRRWARTALSLVNALISVLVIPGALQGFAYSTAKPSILLAISALLIGTSWRLIMSPHIKAYFNYRSAAA